MTDPNTPSTPSGAAATAPAFYPWRDEYGREHPGVPRCMGETKPRNARSKWGTWHECKRKGVVKWGMYGDREAWFCLQHDPRREDDRRVAALAPTLLDLVREALDLVPTVKRSAEWRRRAEAVLARAAGACRPGREQRWTTAPTNRRKGRRTPMKTRLEKPMVVVAMMFWTAAANAQGLSRARTTLQSFQSELLLFVPIVAVVSLIILAILWGLRVIHFRTLAQWGGGVLLVGCATQLVNMLLS